uniref:anoctamin-1 n=1 Tax=Panthera onca TaxID=9690 RepID=UPI0029529C6E|nr:anoctamin-1 [Panthera onca]
MGRASKGIPSTAQASDGWSVITLSHPLLNSLSVDPDAECKHGLYFRDGRRKVDYILVYHPKRPSGSRTLARRVQHGDAAPAARGTRQDRPLPGKGDVGAAGGPEPPMDYHEDDKRFRREEYEGNLLEAGLELERDEETKIHGVGFVKIHAPWNVLCREAEFLKLKMPTKKLYHINETRGLLKKINSVLQKITDPIQPKVAGHRPQTTKRLSYPFSREKQHLFDLSDKDSFFDSKTRSTIVYEILKRTTCTKAKYSMGQGEGRKKDSALLSKRRKCSKYGITSLLANGVYSAAYPLHDGDYEGENVEFNDRKLLYQEWASYGVFYKYQPIDLVRKYFGEKIGLYFAWLGVYTQMLIPASVVGIIVFLYGCATVDENIPSMEMCDQRHNITMCPLCDKTCSYWKMSSACATARASHLFDNPATVFFSVFMALWGKDARAWRRFARGGSGLEIGIRALGGSVLTCPPGAGAPVLASGGSHLVGDGAGHRSYGSRGLEEEVRTDFLEEVGHLNPPRDSDSSPTSSPPRPGSHVARVRGTGCGALADAERVAEPVGVLTLASHPLGVLTTRGSVTIEESSGSSMCKGPVAGVRGRVKESAGGREQAGRVHEDPRSPAGARVLTGTDQKPVPSACCAKGVPVSHSGVRAADIGTAWKKVKGGPTQLQWGQRVVTLVTTASSTAGAWAHGVGTRCSETGSCPKLPEGSVGFLPPQASSYAYQRLHGHPREHVPTCQRSPRRSLGHLLAGRTASRACCELGRKMKKFIRYLRLRRQSPPDHDEYGKKRQRYEADYTLEPFAGLTPEYMEMIIQFGFVTLFVASFPLAPLFALLNNIIEIRLDAKKFVTELRRPVAVRAKDIGIWYNILRGVGKLAVIINAFVISFTSDFIPRLVYLYMYSQNGTMHGFVNHTLSSFNVSDFQNGTAPNDPLDLGYEVQICRYKDYREPPWSEHKYDISKDFWAVLAARLAFVIVFQNLVMFMSDFVDWVIPDIPKDISQQIHKEKVLMVELFMREEQGKQRLLGTWMEKDRKKDEPCNSHGPKAGLDSPEYPGGAL